MKITVGGIEASSFLARIPDLRWACGRTRYPSPTPRHICRGVGIQRSANTAGSRTDVVFLFALLRFATARTLRTLGVVPRMAERSTAKVVGHDLRCLTTLGYEQEPSRPVIRLWNKTRHVESEAIE